jgi:Flp pilus assembly protein TadD
LYAQLLIQLGREREAPQWLARSDPTSKIRLSTEGILLARAGDVAGALSKKARLEQLYGDEAYYHFAAIDAQLGRTDEAFADLDRAWAIKDSTLAELMWNPWFDPIRHDPRYAALIHKIGLAN